MGKLASNFFITLKFFPLLYRNEEEPVCTLKQAKRHTCGSHPTSECSIEVRRGFVLLDSVKRSKFNSNCLLNVCYTRTFFSEFTLTCNVGFIYAADFCKPRRKCCFFYAQEKYFIGSSH